MNNLAKYDLLGLGAPVFGFLEPGNVAVFLKRMGPLSGKNCFIFTTHGGHPGNIFPSMAGKLKRVGLRVIGSFSCDGHYYLPTRFSPWYTDGHPDEVDLKQAADFGREMVAKSERLSKGEMVPLPKFKWLKGGIYHNVASRRRERRQVRLTFDKEKCTYPECRLCVDNCPVGAINLSVDRACPINPSSEAGAALTPASENQFVRQAQPRYISRKRLYKVLFLRTALPYGRRRLPRRSFANLFPIYVGPRA